MVKLLKWLNPKINKLKWRMLSEDSLKLDDCLAGCQCGRNHCTEDCEKDCRRHCRNEIIDEQKWQKDFLYVRKYMPPSVKAVNWRNNWVMDRKGRLRGPYTYQSWLRYGFWAFDTFHETGPGKRDVYWHQIYFRNEKDYYGGSYNHFYQIQMLMIRKLNGLEEQHLAANNVTRGFDVYHNIMPRDKKDKAKIRNAGHLITTPEPHHENLRQFHKIRKRPLGAELKNWEHQDKKAKLSFVRKNEKKVRNWYPTPEGQNLTHEEAQAEADERFDLWYPKVRHVPIFIPKGTNKMIPPAFPTKLELQREHYKFNIKTLENWLETGAIYMLKENEIPDMVVPAVYANMQKKGRMCVDGGWIKQLEAYSVRCKLEDLSKTMVVLQKGMFMTKCDDKRGFHLFKLGKEGRKLTAFGLFGEDWEYRVAAFGIPGSPGMFQLTNMIAVNYGRCFGIDWQCYLDDRIMLDVAKSIRRAFGVLQPQNAIRAMLLLTGDGNFVSLAKSELVPTMKIQFLGMDLDTSKGTISVPQDKWLKFTDLLRTRTLGSAC